MNNKIRFYPAKDLNTAGSIMEKFLLTTRLKQPILIDF